MKHTIKRGKHTTFRLPRIYLGTPNAYKGTFRFERDCWYIRPNDHVDWLDINKLTGLSFGLHLKNSLRIGWRPLFDQKEQIELFAYSYNNEKRVFQSLGFVKTDQEYSFQIRFEHEFNRAVFRIDDQLELSIPYHFSSVWWGYKLYPYFGGNMTAPQKMHINVQSNIIH